jgi:hypothetical protein
MIAQNAKIFGKIGAQSLANVDIHSQQLPRTNFVSSSVVNAWTRYRGSSPGRSGHGELTPNVFMPWRSKTGTELSCSLPILLVWSPEPRALASPYPVRCLSRWGKATWYRVVRDYVFFSNLRVPRYEELISQHIVEGL